MTVDLLNTETAIDKPLGTYDTKILDFCDGVARTREEIQKYINYSSKSNFITYILKPLVESNLLIPTAKKNSKN